MRLRAGRGSDCLYGPVYTLYGVFILLLAVLFPVRYAVQGMGHGDKSLFSGMAEMAARIAMSLWVVPVYGFTAVCISEGVTFLAGILVNRAYGMEDFEVKSC